LRSARNTALLHLKPVPKPSIHTRSPFLAPTCLGNPATAQTFAQPCTSCAHARLRGSMQSALQPHM
jgi:hypothetical protein